MSVAVTGAGGRIGRAVERLLVGQGHSVVAIDRIRFRAHPPRGVRDVRADVTESRTVERILRRCDAVIHLAVTNASRPDASAGVFSANVTATYNVLCAAARHGIPRVCIASSVNALGGVYSREPRFDYFPIDEEHPTYNEDAYGLAKWVGEQAADSIARRHSWMSIATLRFHAALTEVPVVAPHELDARDGARRDLWGWVSLDSAAEACVLSITRPFQGHEVFNIVAPETYATLPSRELASRYFAGVPLRTPLLGRASFFSTGKAHRILGWVHRDAVVPAL